MMYKTYLEIEPMCCEVQQPVTFGRKTKIRFAAASQSGLHS